MLWFIFHLENQKEISTQTHTKWKRVSAVACGWREMDAERKHTNFFFHYGYFFRFFFAISSLYAVSELLYTAPLPWPIPRADSLYSRMHARRRLIHSNEHSACANHVGSCFSSSFSVCFLLSPFVRLLGRSFVRSFDRSFFASSFSLS